MVECKKKNMYDIDYLLGFAKKMRLRILELAYGVGKNGAHVGGGLSVVEILTTLYGAILNFDINNPFDKNRDRLIVSKGHCAIALFTALEEVGFLSKDELNQFEINGSPFYAHAFRNLSMGIEFSGGSLSLGLSYAVGVALSCKLESVNNHIYVLLGDGECDEGLVWESLMSAAHFNLTNLTIIVDCNDLQSDGLKKDVMNQISLADKFTAFGFHTSEINGHDIVELNKHLALKSPDKPNAIIAKTVKGKGVSFMENNKDWHHNVLSFSQYEKAIAELQ
jgi:transketolase